MAGRKADVQAAILAKLRNGPTTAAQLCLHIYRFDSREERNALYRVIHYMRNSCNVDIRQNAQNQYYLED